MGRFSRLGNSLYEGTTSIDFVGKKWLWYSVSGVIVVIAVAGLWFKGLNLGIEFSGGVEYKVSAPASKVNQETVDSVREVVRETGVEAASSPIVNTSGQELILVQTEEMSVDESTKVAEAIAAEVGVDAKADIATQEIGPSWGEQVAKRALTGLIVFLVLVVLFIWAYFREWKMSVAALVALAHDVVITVGVYAISGFEVTPATVTGVLTILGFSLYDTVVVFDKVRENVRAARSSRQTYGELANLAVNQTLVRSVNTSIVALLPVAAILYVGVVVLGSSSMNDLALALFVGMAAGTYSSVFIATPLAAHLKSGERDVIEADRRARARARRVDRYADVPVFTEDMPVVDDPEAPVPVRSAPEPGPDRAPFQAPSSGAGATGSGRVVPEPKAPIRPSPSAGRSQPTRKPRSQRGK